MAETMDLERLLDLTRERLIAGDMGALADLVAGTEQALENLGTADGALVKRLAVKAGQNERLIAAAVKGVRAAQRRSRELTDEGRFSIYDAGGRRDQPGLPPQESARRF
jgi:hypothetical protein